MPERPAYGNQTVWEAIADMARYGHGFAISGDATAVLRARVIKGEVVAMGGPIHGRQVRLGTLPDASEHIVVPTTARPYWDNDTPRPTSGEGKTTNYAVQQLFDGRPVLVWEHFTGQPDARKQS